MEIIGIICEYNPFHNGHRYHIEKIKELFPSSLIILVLNGYFMQRGDISVLTKEDKVKIALEENIDIVIEHPFIFSSNSADIFAESAVTLLEKMGCSKLVFGSESNNINLIKEAAKKILDNSKNIKENLNKGLSYPASLNVNISSPNDILGISYVKAIIKNNYKIEPITIKRTNDYHDLKSTDNIISASNIRKKHKEKLSVDKYTSYQHLIKKVDEDLLFKLLQYKINTEHNLDKYLTVDEGIEYRLLKYINKAKDLDEFITLVKTKRYTFNRIKRMLIHILIGLTKEDKDNTNIDYIKLLGFNKKGQKYLSKEKDILITSKIPDSFISRKYELKASIIYDLLTNQNTYEFELENKPIKKI